VLFVFFVVKNPGLLRGLIYFSSPLRYNNASISKKRDQTVDKEYEAVIGLEIHAQLRTETKIFCGCSAAFGGEPNAATCPVCLGLPGALPVLNKKVLEMAAKAALSLNLKINYESIFARKNYFYPDLPKGYQISQYDRPFSEHGWVEIPTSERDEQARPIEWRRSGFVLRAST